MNPNIKTLRRRGGIHKRERGWIESEGGEEPGDCAVVEAKGKGTSRRKNKGTSTLSDAVDW